METYAGVKLRSVIPILRMFDVAKAREFYLDYLGFEVEFEHRFHENAPLFMGIRRDGIQIFLSEHHGDGTPGTHIRVEACGIANLQRELAAKGYGHANPSIIEQEWGQRELTVVDPCNNRLTFSEPYSER